MQKLTPWDPKKGFLVPDTAIANGDDYIVKDNGQIIRVTPKKSKRRRMRDAKHIRTPHTN